MNGRLLRALMMPHLDLAGNEQILDYGAVGLVEAGMVQPNAKLQRVAQVAILQHQKGQFKKSQANFCKSH